MQVSKIITKPRQGIRLNTAHPLAQWLVGYYKFNEGSGTILNDLSTFNNPATLTNFALSGYNSNWSGSPFGGGLHFDDTNDYAVTAKVPPNLVFPFTLMCWMRLSSLSFTGSEAVMVSIVDPASTNEYWLGLENTTQSFRAVIQSGSFFWLRRTGGTPPFDLNWHQYAGVFRALNNIDIYVDGVLWNTQSTSSGTPTTPTGLTQVSIGGFLFNTSSFQSVGATKIIDEVRIYNRALSADEIKILRANPHIDIVSGIRTFLPISGAGNFFRLFY